MRDTLTYNPILFDMCRIRNDYTSNPLLVRGTEKGSQKMKFSLGYNEGRNRRELLALFPSRRTTDLDPENSFISLTKSVISNEDENQLTLGFLRSSRRLDHSGRFVMNLRGTRIEKHFNRRFHDGDLDLLFDFLLERPTICGLYLSYNNLTDYGFAKLSDFLASHHSIIHVNVMNNNITHLDQKKLVEDVCNWKVQCLNLRGNKIAEKGGEAMAHVLTKNCTIRHLALGETEQTVRSVIAIVNTLIQFGGNETLTKLDLTRTLTRANAGELCRHLACLLEVNRVLVELVLSKNSISDLDLEILLGGLNHRNVLSRLNLSCNRISSHGAELIANVLPKSELKLLVLACNTIGDTGAMAIGRIFAFTKLSYLDISRNQIGDLGMAHLAWAICRPMDGLFIFGNKFSEYAAQVIHSQITDLCIDPKILDIRIWLDAEENVRYTRRNISGYSEWYYYVPEWKKNFIVQHCCCPIRGGTIQNLRSEN